MGNKIKSFILLNLGALLDACGFYFFLAPNNIAAGGISGLALVINKFLPFLPLGGIILTLSILLLILGFITIGSVYGFKTVYCSITIPVIIWLLEKIYPLSAPLLEDLIIQLFFGVLISSIGLAILFNQNASSGGTDIVARIIYQFYHLDIGKGLLLVDFIITLAATYVFGLQKGLYALLGVILYGFIVDYVVEGITISKQVIVITPKSKEVKNFITVQLGRGATVYKAEGAFTGEEKEVIMTVLKRQEFVKLRDFIKKTDPDAFITVQNIHEVLGEGFKPLT
ncbi:YitT family protein [Thermosyntropha sp.]|uniref:YitT family protein n=1 Tax=Thermosyntropha sp. TaxID=2740820 RepID=UPI0025F05ABE|nr:YitT family protein [Thermosyntropha sp.]MBO8159622.1 YitT family protein [Thermosyntropha sp.]